MKKYIIPVLVFMSAIFFSTLSHAQFTIRNTLPDHYHAKALYSNKVTNFVGNKHGRVTVVDFFDYLSKNSRIITNELEDLTKTDKYLKVVLVPYPKISTESALAAKAVMAAKLQNKGKQFQKALLTYDKPITKIRIYILAKKTGISIWKLKNLMNNPKVLTQLVDNMVLGSRMNIDEVPTITIGYTKPPHKTIILLDPPVTKTKSAIKKYEQNKVQIKKTNGQNERTVVVHFHK